MTLRQWQAECIRYALRKFHTLYSHFMCLATPGAGKTHMASELSVRLLDGHKVDFVIVFTPSLIVAKDFQSALEETTGRSFNGQLGAAGMSVTYQSMQSLPATFWELFEQYRVFAIFDEIHHCAGDSPENANAWGERLISKVQGNALHTLALSGTPWRSDNTPIALAKYCDRNGDINVDYTYGLSRAISDNVCRRPHITVLDNHQITLKTDNASETFHSFSHLLKDSDCRYLDIITHPPIIKALLRRSMKQLNAVRKSQPDSAGLIVATSIDHAKLIERCLNEFDETAVVVTYREKEPIKKIHNFKVGQSKWIISVGMISEGTNIPRLSVCCYLSLIKTELYFRQVLGRVLRQTSDTLETGHFFMLAHPTLIEYAKRVSVDIPIGYVSSGAAQPSAEPTDTASTDDVISTEVLPINLIFQPKPPVLENTLSLSQTNDPLADWYNSTIDSLGRFKAQIFEM